MKQNKRRVFKFGALFLLMGLFFVLLTGCFETTPVSNKNLELAYSQTQIDFASGDTELSVTQNFLLPKTVSGFSVEWISSNPNIVLIKENGDVVVTRTNEDQEVYVTAKIGSDGNYELKIFKLVIKGDETVEPVLVRYEVKFFVEGIQWGETQFVEEEGKVLMPINPHKQGHRFEGWFLDRAFNYPFNAESKIIGDLELYGKFVAGGYLVRFFVHGNQYGQTQEVKYGDSAVMPDDPTELQLGDFDFAGWDRNSLIVIDNLDIHAKVTPIPYFTVEFVDHDGTILKEAQSVRRDKDAVPPNEPTREGHTFKEWDTAYTNIQETLTITAVYTVNRYNITYVIDESAINEETRTTYPYDYNERINKPQIPEVPGYTFSWKQQIPDRMPANEVVIHGAYEPITYTITYKVEGQDDVVEPHEFGTEIEIRDLLKKDGYSFTWNRTLPETMPAENITITGKFTIINYTITYVLGEGEQNHANNPSTYTINTPTITLESASKEGHTFDGWFVGDNKVTKIEEGSTENVTLTPQFTINKYLVRFLDYDGTVLKSDDVAHGSDAVVPEDPSRIGYTFKGWYLDKELQNEATFPLEIVAPKDLYAKYEIINYTITYMLGEGEQNHTDNPPTFTIENLPITLKSATKEGHTFEGWYSDEELQNKVAIITLDNVDNFILRPDFKEILYTVTLSNEELTSQDALENVKPETPVTIQVEVPAGKRIEKFLVDNRSVQLTDELTYTLTVTKDHTVSVLFKDYPQLGTPGVLEYTVGETSNMGGGNQARALGQSEDLFVIKAYQEDPNNNVGLNKDGSIRLYTNKTGNGNKLLVENLSDKKIVGVEIVLGGGKDVIESNNPSLQIILGEQIINITDLTQLKDVTLTYNELNIDTFSLQNTQLEGSGNSQIWIKKIIVTFEGGVPEPEKVIVTFDLQGGTLEGLQLNQEVTKGDAIADPGNPTKEGYTFIGWRLPNSEENYNFDTAVNLSITLKAHYEKEVIPEPDKFTVTVTGDGVTHNQESLVNLELDTKVLFTFAKEGYILEEVKVDGTPVEVSENKYELNVSANHQVVVTWLPTVATVRGLAVDTQVTFVGIVTYFSTSNNNVYLAVADETDSIYIFKAGNASEINVGDKIKIVGKRGAYERLEQIVNATVTFISANNDLPDPITIDSLENIKDYQSQHINISNLSPVSLSEDSRNLTVQLGEHTVIIRSIAGSEDVFNKVKNALEAKNINLTNVYVDWYRYNPQLLIENVNQMEVIEFTDAEKAAEIIETFDYHGKSYNTGSVVELATTYPKYNPQIIWSYNPAEAVVDNKWVAVNGLETTVVATATIKFGDFEDKTYQATITVLAEEETFTVELEGDHLTSENTLTDLLANETVVIKVINVPDNQEIDQFTVDGIAYGLTDELTYTLTVTANHKV